MDADTVDLDSLFDLPFDLRVDVVMVDGIGLPTNEFVGGSLTDTDGDLASLETLDTLMRSDDSGGDSDSVGVVEVSGAGSGALRGPSLHQPVQPVLPVAPTHDVTTLASPPARQAAAPPAAPPPPFGRGALPQVSVAQAPAPSPASRPAVAPARSPVPVPPPARTTPPGVDAPKTVGVDAPTTVRVDAPKTVRVDPRVATLPWELAPLHDEPAATLAHTQDLHTAWLHLLLASSAPAHARQLEAALQRFEAKFDNPQPPTTTSPGAPHKYLVHCATCRTFKETVDKPVQRRPPNAPHAPPTVICKGVGALRRVCGAVPGAGVWRGVRGPGCGVRALAGLCTLAQGPRVRWAQKRACSPPRDARVGCSHASWSRAMCSQTAPSTCPSFRRPTTGAHGQRARH